MFQQPLHFLHHRLMLNWFSIKGIHIVYCGHYLWLKVKDFIAFIISRFCRKLIKWLWLNESIWKHRQNIDRTRYINFGGFNFYFEGYEWIFASSPGCTKYYYLSLLILFINFSFIFGFHHSLISDYVITFLWYIQTSDRKNTKIVGTQYPIDNEVITVFIQICLLWFHMMLDSLYSQQNVHALYAFRILLNDGCNGWSVIFFSTDIVSWSLFLAYNIIWIIKKNSSTHSSLDSDSWTRSTHFLLISTQILI